MKDMLKDIIKAITEWGTMSGTQIFMDENSKLITIVAGTTLHEIFEYGLSAVQFCNLSDALKDRILRENELVKEAYELELGEFDEFPEQYGCPSELEFDSLAEYNEFKADFKDKLEKDFMANCQVLVHINNEVEANIYKIADDNGYEVNYEDGIINICPNQKVEEE